jgi:hypothetical protein
VVYAASVRTIVLLGLGMFVVIAVAGVVALLLDDAPTLSDEQNGADVAAAIRRAADPAVRDVFYMEGDYVDSASVEVSIPAGTNETALHNLVCVTVVNAVAQSDGSGGFSVAVGDQPVFDATIEPHRFEGIAATC